MSDLERFQHYAGKAVTAVEALAREKLDESDFVTGNELLDHAQTLRSISRGKMPSSVEIKFCLTEVVTHLMLQSDDFTFSDESRDPHKPWAAGSPLQRYCRVDRIESLLADAQTQSLVRLGPMGSACSKIPRATGL